MVNKSLLAYWLISLLANGGEAKFRIFKNFEFWMLNKSLLAYWLISLLANGGETKFRDI